MGNDVVSALTLGLAGFRQAANCIYAVFQGHFTHVWILERNLGRLGRSPIGWSPRSIAFFSLAGGIPLYGLFFFAKDFQWAILWINLFMFFRTWTPSAALRPLCAALTRNASERAQIVSMWIVLERLLGAVFGAPWLAT